MVTDLKKPHQDFPKLEAKGSETKHFGPAFLPVLQSLLDTSKEEHSKMVEALDCLVNLLSVFDAADMVLTEMEFDQATNLAKRFFDVYDWLHRWAARVDRKLFHITMKFHTGHHLVHDSQHLNPKACWNFRSEDFVGKISRLGGSVAMGVKSTKLSSKIAAKYRALLHMQLKRLGFGVIPYQDDPWQKVMALDQNFWPLTLTKGSGPGHPWQKGVVLDKRILDSWQKGVVLDKRILDFTLLTKELVFDKKMTLDKRVLSLTKGFPKFLQRVLVKRTCS